MPDFHLTTGSPAIDKGKSLSEVTWDHAGGKRPFGAAFDIGAYASLVHRLISRVARRRIQRVVAESVALPSSTARTVRFALPGI